MGPWWTPKSRALAVFFSGMGTPLAHAEPHLRRPASFSVVGRNPTPVPTLSLVLPLHKILDEEEDYVFCPNGLFPAPLRPETDASSDILRLYTFLGEFMGRAMVDKRIIDLPLSVPFLKMLRYLGISQGLQ